MVTILSMFTEQMQNTYFNEQSLGLLILSLLLLSLATWRISFALTGEEGPFQMLNKLRLIALRLGIISVFQCMWCMSIWVAFILMFVPIVVMVPFSISALTIGYNKLIVGI